MVVLRAHEVVRQVLLPHPVAGEVVRVFIALLALEARAVGVYVLQLARIGPGLARAHVRHGGVDAHHHAVRLGGGGQQYGGLRQRQPRLRQAQLQRAVHAGLDDAGRLRVGEADVLAGRAEQPPAGPDEVPGLQQAGQVVQRGVRVRAAQGLHERAEGVEMVVPLPVVAHGAALRGALRVLERDFHRAADARRGGKEQLHGIDGLAHVPAAALGDVFCHAVLKPDGHALTL